MTATDYNTAQALNIQALRAMGWWPFASDPTTSDGAAEIVAYQIAHGLAGDGKIGPSTRALLRSIYRPQWGKVPHGLAEILARFGDPRPAGVSRAKWAESNLVTVTLANGRKIRNVHRVIAAEFAELLAWAVKLSSYDPQSIQTWNVRHKRGGNRPAGDVSWSVHSWAVAFDADPSLNPWGNKPHSPIVSCPMFAAVFRCAGWSIGADWKPADTMHLQAATGY